MDADKIDSILEQTLEDLRLSRGEKRALGELLADLTPDSGQLAYLCNRAFEMARRHVEGRDNRLVLDWLEQVAKVLRASSAPSPGETRAEAYFTPNRSCPARIAELFERARTSVDVCVFTITDDQIAGAILSAHLRGVAIRIITDDQKAEDYGSDVASLAAAGIGVRTDRAEAHMHHKFAIFDGGLLLTGSYNWTRGAAMSNQENFVLTDEPRLVRAFGETFEVLWRQFE